MKEQSNSTEQQCTKQSVNNRYLIWRKQVVRLAVRGGIIRHSTKVTNDFMKPYFDDGYSPASALNEEYGKSWRPSYNGC